MPEEEEEKREYCIYMHKNKINGKIYIGQTKNTKHRWHPAFYQNCTYFYHAIQKYGWENFEHIILEDHLTQDEANQKEAEYIKQYHSGVTENGYNLLTGGGNGYQYIDHATHPNNKAVICLETQKVYPSMKIAAAETDTNYKNLSQACTGEKKTAGGLHWSYYTEGQTYPLPEKKKFVKCLETNQVFKNFADAARSLGVPEAQVPIYGKNIGRACRGQQYTAYGYHYQYVTDVDI